MYNELYRAALWQPYKVELYIHLIFIMEIIIMFKKLDFVIIAVLMVLSFLPEIILGASVGKGLNNTYAEITVAGKL